MFSYIHLFIPAYSFFNNLNDWINWTIFYHQKLYCHRHYKKRMIYEIQNVSVILLPSLNVFIKGYSNLIYSKWQYESESEQTQWTLKTHQMKKKIFSFSRDNSKTRDTNLIDDLSARIQTKSKIELREKKTRKKCEIAWYCLE